MQRTMPRNGIASRTQPVGLLAGASTPPKRVTRAPVHNFNISQYPYSLQPFMLAPVLAGETLENLLLNARSVSEQVKSPLIGWWLEQYFFYVPLTAIDKKAGNALNKDMLLDYGAARTTSATGGTPDYFSTARLTGVDWMKECMATIVPHYFRDGESDTGFTFGGCHVAKMKQTDFAESFFFDSEVPTTSIDQTPTADITGQQISSLEQTWQALRDAMITDMTFEDYIQSFGVKLPPENQMLPQLLRWTSQFQQPSNTVNPANVYDTDDVTVLVPAGKPTSALSYNTQLRHDKARFFKEPGFIVGIQCWRPKVYKKQVTHASAELMDAFQWLPALLLDKPEISLKRFAANTGPLGAIYTTKAYWLDMRDLFLYGDSWRTFSTSAAQVGKNYINLETISGTDEDKWTEYPNFGNSGTDPSWLDYFVDTTYTYLHTDGAVSLKVKGTQIDNT